MDERDELGAHVSAAGGVEKAPGRAREIGAVALQMFTKQAQRWHEPELEEVRAAAFRAERSEREIGATAAHDSYLIDVASRLARNADAITAALAAVQGDLAVPPGLGSPGHERRDTSWLARD